MTSVRPQQLVHRGTVLVQGYLFDPRVIGEEACRRRILATWEPGAHVDEVAHGWMLRFASPRWRRADLAPAAPLVTQGGALSTAPLAAREVEQLPGADTLVVVREGVAAGTAASGKAVDIAGWIDLEGFTVESVRSLSPPPAAIAAPEVAKVDRAVFGMPPAAAELAQVLAALRGDPAAQATAPTGPPASLAARPVGAGPPRWWSALLSLLGLGRSHAPAQSGVSALAPRQAPRERVALAEAGGGAKARPWLDRLREALARWVSSTRLARVLGQRQADYLMRMMEMFQDGDFDAALRHAIPLASTPGEGPVIPALGVPAPRTSLAIGLGAGRIATSSMGLGPTLFAQLQEMYRQAVARLERSGRIEEAAFVLAELLQASAEAVSFLERHGRLRLAAELAEGRGLAPELVVRQWFIAGNVARAVEVARRTGCFGAAVVQLERTDPERGKALRIVWAETLAEAGDYPAAVLAVWPAVEARNLAKRWIERALALGGATEAVMLIRQVVLVPETFPATAPRVQELCDEGTLEASMARRALAEALVANSSTAETTTLARAVLRSHVRDLASGITGADPRFVQRLQGLAADAVLQSDLPAVSTWVRGAPAREPRTFTLARHDTGALAVRDVAVLPGGRLLVALGEAGVRLLTRDGRTQAHFDLPAERLVVSDTGWRAIGMIARGEGWRLSRFDLAARTASEWCEVRLDLAAADYDGSLWFVASEGAVQAVDATASRLKALWRVDQVGAIRSLSRSTGQLAFLTEGEQAGLWQYDLPRFTLRSRVLPEVVKLAGSSPVFVPWHGQGLAALSKVEGVAPLQALRLDTSASGWRDAPVLFTAPMLEPLSLTCAGSWIAAGVREPARLRVEVVRADRRAVATLVLEGSQHLMLRLGPDDTLVAADDRGRVIVLQLEHAVVLRDLRLS